MTLVAHNPDGTSPSSVALSLYNNTPGDFNDPFNLQGHRLLAQSQSGSNPTAVEIDQTLAAGTYFVGVSGAGNLDFDPFLVGSGHRGQTGDYQLVVSDTSLHLSASNGPTVLNSDPSVNASLTSSPLIVRVELSSGLDPNTVAPDDTVQLIESTDAVFGNADDISVPLSSVNFSSSADELQLIPAAPLAPGHYRLYLSGNQTLHADVLSNLNGVPLGADAHHTSGQDAAINFEVAGIEGRTGSAATADDTPSTAHNLGNITNNGVIHANGVIGDDPFYNLNLDPSLNPANDVDMYHFQVTGAGRYAMSAEVFAGRIGSSLDPGVSLYRMDPSTGLVEFVAGNNNTDNSTVDSTGWNTPLYTDAALFAGLTAGDYYVAVSSSFNTPSPSEQQMPGSDGMFNPNVSHSGSLGMNTGSYELNVQVTADSTAPTVLSTTPNALSTLTSAPDQLVVRFSESVNVQQLAFDAYRQTTPTDLSSVFIQPADGTRIYPRLESVDPSTNTATFLLLDRLPDGVNQLHLSGSLGLTDLAGNSLVGNTSSGDYVVPITVASTIHPNGPSGQSNEWVSDGENGPSVQPDNLGTLFPHEFQAGITVTRSSPASQSGSTDEYQFTVLQNQDYQFTLGGQTLPSNVHLSLLDLNGKPAPSFNPDNRTVLASGLPAGTYVLRIGGGNASQPLSHDYQVHLTMLGNADNPPPLTDGPAPAMLIRLAGTPAPTTPVPTTPVESGETSDRIVASTSVSQVIIPAPVRSGFVPVITFATLPSGNVTPVQAQPASWMKQGSNALNLSTASSNTNSSDANAASGSGSLNSRLNSKTSTGELDALKDPLVGRTNENSAQSKADNESPTTADKDDSATMILSLDSGDQANGLVKAVMESNECSSSASQRLDVILAGIADSHENMFQRSGAISHSNEQYSQNETIASRLAWIAAALATAGGLRKWHARRDKSDQMATEDQCYVSANPLRRINPTKVRYKTAP